MVKRKLLVPRNCAIAMTLPISDGFGDNGLRASSLAAPTSKTASTAGERVHREGVIPPAQ